MALEIRWTALERVEKNDQVSSLLTIFYQIMELVNDLEYSFEPIGEPIWT